MRDKEIEDLLRETWQPKPPAELKQRALTAPQAARQDRSPLRRFALKTVIALAATAAAACIVLVLSHPGAPGRSTPTTSAPPARVVKRIPSPMPESLAGAANQPTVAQKRIQVVVEKPPTSKPKSQVASRPDLAAGARVSYVDAEKFDAAHAEVADYTTSNSPATAHREPDGVATPEARMAYTRPSADRLRMTGRTPAGARILSPDMEDVR